MKVDVTFVNFPVSDNVRQLVADKIEEHVSKFANRVANARAVFSVEGPQHTVRLHVTAGGVNTFVSATALDVGRCVDQAIDKLDASMRKINAKKKTRRHGFAAGVKNGRTVESTVSDDFDDEDFEDKTPRAIRAVG